MIYVLFKGTYIGVKFFILTVIGCKSVLKRAHKFAVLCHVRHIACLCVSLCSGCSFNNICILNVLKPFFIVK